MLSQPSINATS